MIRRHVMLLVTALTVLSASACQRASRGGVPRAMPAPNPATMLVTTAWLAKHRADRDLVVLHVGNKAQYDSGHIDGSRLTSLDEVSLPTVPGGLTLQMAGVEQLTAWAVRNGIGDRTRVIVVPHDGALQSATRVFITLAYLGAMDRISLLDGSFQAWKKEARPVTTTSAAPAPAVTFAPTLRPDIIATIAQVEAATTNGTRHIIDARLTRFFNGDGGGYPRPGHIPTAVNVPLSSVSTDGYLKPVSELKALFAAAGVDQSKPVITYCHIGQQATLLWFVATMLGHDARMFDGSFQEWSGTARLPVIAPPAK
jgi:thiosulfate/3-mercaptopyruvate sulfurtransferase